jgi:hypothetical protein
VCIGSKWQEPALHICSPCSSPALRETSSCTRVQ